MNKIQKPSLPDFKKVKVANALAIGGMIALGKTTLAKGLQAALSGSQVIYELNENDNLMMLLLEKMYQRENNDLYGSLFQLYFVLNRFENYKQNANHEHITIFDRSIFEDWLFASHNIDRPSVFNYYNALWMTMANELVYLVGIPKLYIILDGDFELFKQRIMQRSREVEIQNFEKNEIYFQSLWNGYKEYLVGVCKDFGIDYLIVDATLPTQKQVEKVIAKLQELKEWEEC